MNYLTAQVTFQEVPDEISLCFLITGCQLKCPGCHSPKSWSPKAGSELNRQTLEKWIQKYSAAITCVCFLGGEWEPETLVSLCRFVQEAGLKTCLYTGQDEVSPEIRAVLNYLKTGRYLKELGGLASKQTNQNFINVQTNENLNHKFNAQGGQHGATV